LEPLVSVQPQPRPEPDPQIAAAIRAMYRGKREAPLAVEVRDRFGELFPDAQFAEAFGQRGRPGWSPGRLALVTVPQKTASLTDRQAADEVRENLAWKYALGLRLDDPCSDHFVLSEFRTRVVAHQLEEKVLDLLLDALREHGLVAPGGRQRTDSTHIVAAVRDLNRLELVGESVRCRPWTPCAPPPPTGSTRSWTSRTGAGATRTGSIPGACRRPRPSRTNLR
jgi:transposase